MNVKTDRRKRETYAQFYYPEVDRGVRHLRVGLEDIDGSVPEIRISYDYERAGWKVERLIEGKWKESAFLFAPHDRRRTEE